MIFSLASHALALLRVLQPPILHSVPHNAFNADRRSRLTDGAWPAEYLQILRSWLLYIHSYVIPVMV
jgi:hypothetical protein